MTILEIVLAVVALILLGQQCFVPRRDFGGRGVMGLALLVFLLHWFVDGLRWQMGMIYLLLPILIGLGLWNFRSHIAVRSLSFLIGIVLGAASVFYALNMPYLALPEPSGPHAVGTVQFVLTDLDRDEALSDEVGDKRRLFVEVWYPARNEEDGTARAMWSNLYGGKLDAVSFLTGYLGKVKSHSYVEAAPIDGEHPLILFNHGLQMFTAQNTLLMEHLASHGYIVASIGHPYESLRVHFPSGETVLPEFVTNFGKFSEAMQWIAESSKPILEAQEAIRDLDSREERAAIVMQVIREADDLNEIVQRWSDDTRFVLDSLLNGVGTEHLPMIDAAQIGVMGMSIGGATAAEFAKSDSRVRAGINIDGLYYGQMQDEPLNVPFMMLSNADGIGMNDMLYLSAQTDFYELDLPTAKHTDLTDMITVWPVLKIYGQSGAIESQRAVTVVNEVTLAFWQRYLSGATSGSLDFSAMPELESQTK